MSKADEYLRGLEEKGNAEEVAFFKVLKEAVEDDYQMWVGAREYYEATEYLLQKEGKKIVLNEGVLEEDREAVAKYRLFYVWEKVGIEKLLETVHELMDDQKYTLFKQIDALTGEKIEKMYNKLEVVSEESVMNDIMRKTKGGPINLDQYMDEILNRPVLIDFPEEFRAKFHPYLAQLDVESLVKYSRAWAYYLINFIRHEDKWAYTEILPAVAHIIKAMPQEVEDGTSASALFWTATEVVDRCWRDVSDDDDMQRRFRDWVYDLYAPRVGALWPIVNRDRFKFKSESSGEIFDESVGMLLALDDIAERNWEIGDFLRHKATTAKYATLPAVLERRVFTDRTKNLGPDEYFDAVLEDTDMADWASYLDYPTTSERAGVVLSEIFRTDDDARLEGMVRMGVLEKLLMSPHKLGIGVEILNYVNLHLDKLAEIVKDSMFDLRYSDENGYQEEMTETDVLTDLFEAACMGITELNELVPLKKLKEGMAKLGCEPAKLERAMKYARARQRMVSFQRAVLNPVFERNEWGVKLV